MKTDRMDCSTISGVWFAVLAFLSVSAVAQAKTEPVAITVTEQLNRSYTNELVSFPFEARKGECVPQSIQVTGPRGAVAAQLAAIEYWPGKEKEFVKSARLCFVVDELKPLTSNVYTIVYGKKAAAPAATDLKVNPGKGNVEITTADVGVRLPLGGETYTKPAVGKDVPGPLTGMRLGTGAWAGGSELTGNVEVASWKAEITENGPVMARVTVSYTLADSNVISVAAAVAAGDSAVRWDMSVQNDRPDLGVEFRFPPVPGVKQAILPHGYGQWARADRQAVLTNGIPFGSLSPDSSLVNIFAENPPMVRLVAEGGAELQLASQDAGAWSAPVAPLTYAVIKIWELDSIPKIWDAWKRQCMPMTYAADGTLTLAGALTKGRRLWTVSAGAPRLGSRLDPIKDLVLDWPADPKRPTPRVFVGMPEIKDAWARAATDPSLMKSLNAGVGWAAAVVPVLMKPAAERKPEDVARVVKPLRDQLALLGEFDTMRGAIATVTLYDVLVDSDLLTPQERALFRAQMAYLAYVIADPKCWSMERGYMSGNPNMSSSYTLSLGVLACALSDHPMAKTWADRATQWMDKWLTDEVGSNGEWMPEGSHYSYVSLDPMISYAIAAKRAGYHDFSNDPRFKKLLLYFAKFNTPRDLQRRTVNGVEAPAGARSIGAYGRGHGGCMPSFGAAAAFFKQSDPAFSAAMQWMWNESGSPMSMGDGRLGGLDPYYMDKRLPAAPPAWGSELFPGIGALLRAGFNTPNESFVIDLASVQSLRNLDIWTPEVGGISQWFGRGMPLSTCFTFDIGYKERHELLRNGVRLARNWGAPDDPKLPFGHYTDTKFGTFAALPSVDYVCSTFVNTRVDDRDWFPAGLPAFPRVTPAVGTNLTWTRQLLFVKDPNPAGPAWMLLRDTAVSGQPTAWQFWTLSEKIGTPDQVKDPVAFLADKPGRTNAPVRELPMSNRYTALGQFDVDVEYFIARPAATPRHTLRFGGPNGSNARIPEWQDLLHLQMPGDGAYYVAIFPRPRGEAVPTMTALADGKLIKVASAAGTDYAFLATTPGEAAAEGMSVKGTAGSVQDRGAVMVLALGAAGEVRYKEYGIAGEGGASLQVDKDGLLVSVPSSAQAQEVKVTAAGNWSATGAKIKDAKDGALVVSIPAGTTAARLTKR